MSRHLISVKNRQAFINVKDGSYYVDVKTNKKHSCQQRRYYFGVVVPMMTEGFNDMGYDFDEDQTHEEIKKLFLSTTYFLPDNTETKVAGSTKKLTSTEYNELISKCQIWSAEWLSINIPDPGEQAVIKY